MAWNVWQTMRNSARGLIQRYAPTAIKRYQWNREYANGRWQCLNSMPDDCVYPHVERHVRGGCILDLGCGPGSIGVGLKPDAYGSYTGIDISDVAIEAAKSKAAEKEDRQKLRYLRADMLTYRPDRQHDVILFGDVIYYFPNHEVARILSRYSRYLTPEGVFIVRAWLTKQRHWAIVLDIERTYEVLEKQLYQSQICVIAFRPVRDAQPSRASQAVRKGAVSILVPAWCGHEWLFDTACAIIPTILS